MDFETLMSMNYDELLHNQDCRVLLTNYLDTVDSVVNRDVFYVKALTKVGTHLVFEDPTYFTNSQLEKLIQFNYQGSEIAKKEFEAREKSTDEDPVRYKVMEGHFIGHAGRINKIMFEQNQNTDYAETAYNLYVDAINICSEVDEEFTINMCSLLSFTSWEAYEISDDLVWLDRVIQASTAYIEMKNHKDDRVAQALLLRARAECEAYKVLGERGFLEDAIETLEEGVEICSDENLDLKYSLNIHLGNALKKLNIEFRQGQGNSNRQHKAYMTAYQISLFTNNEKSASAIKLAGQTSLIMFYQTKDKSYLDRSREEIMRARDLYDIKQSFEIADCHRRLGEIFRNLFHETKDNGFARAAIKEYQRYFDYSSLQDANVIKNHYDSAKKDVSSIKISLKRKKRKKNKFQKKGRRPKRRRPMKEVRH